MIPVTMMLAMTADGKIAKNDSHFPDWTSKEDKQYFQKITKEIGVIMMGDKTFATLPGPLPGRLNVVFTKEIDKADTEEIKWVSGELEPVLEYLEEKGYKSAILGGGAFLNSLFLEKKLISEIIITIEPKIFGQGISLFSKDADVNMELIDVEKLNNNTIAVRYKLIY